MIKAIYNITTGKPKRLKKAVFYTMLANFINIVPFCLCIEVVNTLFQAFGDKNASLDINKLWIIISVLFVYLIVMLWGEKNAYNANFREAYNISAEGRRNLAEHLRKIPLGFLSQWQ